MSSDFWSINGLTKSGFVRQRQLIPAIVPWSPATLWRKVRTGEFPTPIKLSKGVTAWRAEDVSAWIASKASGAERRPISGAAESQGGA